MYKFIFLLMLSGIIFSQNVLSLDTMIYDVSTIHETGKSPVKILKLDGSDKIHIFCAGEDLNYNDIIDEGDESPSWWIMDNSETAPRKIMNFDRFLKYRPFRPALDKANNILYIPFTGKIMSVDLNAESMDDGDVASIDAQSIDFAGGHLLITVSGGNDAAGRLDVFNLETGQILQTIPGGINIMDCIYYPTSKGISIAILNQGEFGSDNSIVYYGTINHTFSFTLEDSVTVGNTANHILFNNGKLYVTANMSHWVKVIDVASHEVETWHTGTTGWDGPRESVVFGSKLYVTTYSGDVRAFDLLSGQLMQIYEGDSFSKIENVAFVNDNRFISAGPYDMNYQADSYVRVWDKKKQEMVDMIKDVSVGAGPVGLFIDETTNLLHVFCLGNDINENGVLDNGEEAPSWWTVSQNGGQFAAAKKAEFAFGDIKNPFKPAVDFANRIIYLPSSSVIKSYNIDDYTLDDDMIAEYDAAALDLAGTHLLAAVNHYEAPDSIYVINLQTNQVLQRVSAGDNVTDVKYFPLMIEGNPEPVISLAVLTSDEDSLNSKLLYGPIKHMSDFTLDNSIELGKIGSSIRVFENLLGISSFWSNDVSIVNAADNELYTINLGTTYMQGPGDMAAVENVGFIAGTFAGDLIPISVRDSQGNIKLSLREFLPLGIPVNSLAINVDQLKNEIFLAATNSHINEMLNNKVYVLSNQTVSVKQYNSGSVASIKLYPNPANEYITLDADLRSNFGGNIKVEIISILGEKAAEFQLPYAENISHTFNIKQLGLSKGTYILRLFNGSDVKSVPFNVVK
ncbi:MAG: T9SS type A sorting domain-containing protein [Candidatus Kapabacteria bacterium]|nr:T9SS type A sorting domain-containing protein [Candidatus Kapabacteria bacterium]